MNTIDIAKIVYRETERAEAKLTETNQQLSELLLSAEPMTASQMEALAYQQALLGEWQVLWIVARKYAEGTVPGFQVERLKAKVRALRDNLAEDDGTYTTNPWYNAAAATQRKARIAVLVKLQGLFD